MEDEGGNGAEEAYSIVDPVGGIRAELFDPDLFDFKVRVSAGGERLVGR